MLRMNIPKNAARVIFAGAICVIFCACHSVIPRQNDRAYKDDERYTDYKAPKVIGTIKSDEIDESSGVVYSRCNAGVLWTHNDSGDGPFIYALDETGRKLGTWKVAGGNNIDWEDIATLKTAQGECYLYLGDIGDNDRIRDTHIIYRVKEPQVTGKTDSSRKNPIDTEESQAIKFSYPDGRHDAETLMVHPQTSDIYVMSKDMEKPSAVYRLRANADLSAVNKLEKLTDFTVPAIPYGLLTGGEISPDGKRVIICDYFQAYELTLPEGAKSFDDIWKQKPLIVNLGKREQGEGVGYAADGKAIYATSEKLNSPLIKVERK
jgi:hypothetical protein